MAFLDFVASQLAQGKNPLDPIQKFVQVLQAGADTLQAKQPQNNPLTPMASGSIPNPLGQALDIVQPGGQGRIPLVSVGPSPAQNFANVLQRGAQSLDPNQINKRLSQMSLPSLPTFAQQRLDASLPEPLRNRSLFAEQPQVDTKATTAEERLSGPVYQPPEWITSLGDDQKDKAATSPEMAMRFVLKNSGIDAESPAGRYFIQRAQAIQSLYEVQTGSFAGDTSNVDGLMVYMQAWVDRTISSGDNPGAQKLTQGIRAQVPEKVDEILSTTEDGTAGRAWRDLVNSVVQGGQTNELEVYWERLVKPALMAKGVAGIALSAQQEKLSRMYGDYLTESFAGSSDDFGTYLWKHGYSLGRKK